MVHEYNESLEALRNFETLRRKVINLSNVIDAQDDLIVKYQKALELAAFDAVIMLNRNNQCPCEDDCNKEYTIASECKNKLMHRWKGEAGIE